MSYLFLLLSFLFVAQPNSNTDPETPAMTISATGKVELPANQTQFRINVNAEADQPQEAYELHKKREEALVHLLEKYNVSEEDIGYEPIAISKVRQYNREDVEKETYQTRQTVNLTLQDFDVYEKIQVGLIANGFDNFSGSFSNTEMEAGKDKALQRAIQKAKEKAELIARETGVDLGPIIEINYSFDDVQPYAQEQMEMKAVANDSGLMKYEQTVTVSARISIRYYIKQDS